MTQQMSLAKFLDMLRAKGVPAEELAEVKMRYKDNERKLR